MSESYPICDRIPINCARTSFQPKYLSGRFPFAIWARMSISARVRSFLYRPTLRVNWWAASAFFVILRRCPSSFSHRVFSVQDMPTNWPNRTPHTGFPRIRYVELPSYQLRIARYPLSIWNISHFRSSRSRSLVCCIYDFLPRMSSRSAGFRPRDLSNIARLSHDWMSGRHAFLAHSPSILFAIGHTPLVLLSRSIASSLQTIL